MSKLIRLSGRDYQLTPNELLEQLKVAERYMPSTDTWVVEIEGVVEGFIAFIEFVSFAGVQTW